MSQEDFYAGRSGGRSPRITQSDPVDTSAADYVPPWVPDSILIAGSGGRVTVVGRLKNDAADRTFYLTEGLWSLGFVLIRKTGTTYPEYPPGTKLVTVHVLRSTE